MKVILLGGTGVLSRDVAKHCLDANMDLYMVNRGNRPIPDGVNHIKADVHNAKKMHELVKVEKFDVVIDFLAYNKNQLASHMEIFKDKCSQYIFISSATAYSKRKANSLITEASPLTNYSWGYSMNKIRCESYLHSRFIRGIPAFTVIRPYITYGDTRIPYAFIPKRKQWTLIDRILNDKPVVCWDDGRNLCTLTHTDDFARAVIGLIGNKKAYRQAFHITSDERLPWSEILKIIGETVGKKAKIVYFPSKMIEGSFNNMRGELLCEKSYCRMFDNSKIKSAVPGWECKIPFREGIKQTIEYFQNNPGMMAIDRAWDTKVDNLIKAGINRGYKWV